MKKAELVHILERGKLCFIANKKTIKIYDHCGQVVDETFTKMKDLQISDVDHMVDWYIKDQKQKRKEARNGN